ncbi:hypothetical protein K438DRAFT_2180567 [Mycena galopus ATCC 62051]|nr:hypothetical protein K438DRAFT_2180567 [Mycena galopus ATCC 62051]
MDSSAYRARFEAVRTDDFIFSDQGDAFLPLWSTQNSLLFYSFLAPVEDLPLNAHQYMEAPTSFLTPTSTIQDPERLDFLKGPVWYLPQEHWLSWIPKSSLTPTHDDPVSFLFVEPVDYMEVSEDLYGMNSEDSDQEEGKPQEVGYQVVSEWSTPAVNIARRLSELVEVLASSCPWYCHVGSKAIGGDVPAAINGNPVLWVHEYHDNVGAAVVAFRRSCFSILGFIAWISTLVVLEDILNREDALFVHSLSLDTRQKTGVIYHLERDYHEANFPHLLERGVPVHGVLTAKMKGNWCFKRIHQDVWTEAALVLKSEPRKRIALNDLPSYYEWADDWSRSDWYFQNRRAGRLGEWVSRIDEGADFGVIDFHLYGIRWIKQPGVARAYWERFCGSKHSANSPAGVKTSYTFYRQNPITIDEPISARTRRSSHDVELDVFGLCEEGEEIREHRAYMQKTSVVWDQVKNLYAPRPNRSFNSFDGRQDPLPMQRDITGGSSSSSRGGRVRLTEQQGYSAGHRSPTLAQRIADIDEFVVDNRAPPESHNSSPFGDVPVPVREKAPFCHADSVAMDRIQRWSDKSLEREPRYAPYEDLQWNAKWLAQGKLVCPQRSALKLKSIVALRPGIRQTSDILELAIRYGIPFAIFVKRSNVREFRDILVPPFILKTLGSIYEPGFNDITLNWSKTGGNAAAILQVSQFDKGELRLFKGDEGEEFWTTDQLTWSEKNILLGHISSDNPDLNRTLWPTPEVFEAGCSHMRGYLSAGAVKILDGLKDEYFTDPPNLHWYTVSQWHGHFRNGCTGRFKSTEPDFIPDKGHWAEGEGLFARLYPRNWESIDLSDVRIPEVFEPKM